MPFFLFSSLMRYPKHLLKVIESLKKLPGVGTKSAERFAFQLISWDSAQLLEIADVFKEIPYKIKSCNECGCLKGVDDCGFCGPDRRNPSIICVIASARDAFAIDDTGEYKGLFHVLGNLLSPMDGIGPDQINLTKLKNRIQENSIQELVIALDSTLEGDATSLYIKQELETLPIKISRLAFGLPMGSSLDYVDGGTLARAFMGRNHF